MTHLPASWTRAKLRDLGHWKGGGTPSKASPEYWNGSIPWVSPKDMKSTVVRESTDHISPAAVQNSAASIIPNGSILVVTRSGILAHSLPVAVNEIDVTVNQDLKALVLAEGLLPEYIAYALRANERTILDHCVKDGTTVHSIELPSLLEYEIALPPLGEQRRIVAKIEDLFSELDKAVESLTLARAQLKTYRQALLKAAFEGRLTADWRAANPDKLELPETLLARISAERDEWYRTEHRDWEKRCREWDVAGRIGPRPARPEPHSTASPVSDKETVALPTLPADGTYTRLSEIAYVGSGVAVSKARLYEDAVEVAYLRVANVQRGHLNLSQIKTMKVERSMLPSLALRRFDVLFNEGGDRDKLGRGWVWEEAISPCITQNHVFRATLFSPTEARAKLLSHWGNTAGQDYFEKGGKQTTNLASINKTVLKALPVPLMPDSEADALHLKLEASLSQIGATEAEIEAGLAKTEALRQSILQRAFSGRLVPQDPADEPAAALLARLRDAPPPARTRRRKTA